MTRIWMFLLACALLAHTVLAAPLRSSYSADDYAELMTATSYAGALAFCERNQLYTSQVGPIVFEKAKAHVTPMLEAENEMGSVITRILVTSNTFGRAGVFFYDPAMSTFQVAQIVDIRNVEDCRKVSERASQLLAKTRLLDNPVTVPGGVGS